jgi:3-phosphoshikimate 1-carboxyvinyltransferase
MGSQCHRCSMKVEPAAMLRGVIAVPGVKGISQRAVLLGALADGESRIRGFGRAADTESAITVARAIGAEVIEDGTDELRVHGVGLRGAKPPVGPIDCGNAGTVMRLTCGLLAGQTGEYTLVGDESLTMRPHERVAAPLRLMGGTVETTEGHAPIRITGANLHGITYDMPIASAQVKSAILIAGLFATGTTTVTETYPTRDHTERMFESLGVRTTRTRHSTTVWPAERLSPFDLDIPGEFSSAAPLITAAVLLSGSELVIQGVNVNPLRAGLLDVLERMGARIGLYNRRNVGGEAVADLEIRSTPLVATRVEREEVPRLVDELPLVALLGAFARGRTEVTGAEELRAKETDRVETVTAALRAIGVRIEARPDGFVVRGVPSRPKGGKIDAAGDHRIAMLGAIAGLVSREGVRIAGPECASISFPGFYEALATLALTSEGG